MRIKIPSWVLSLGLLAAVLGLAWSVSASPLYRAYLAGRSSGAVVFSIVQAVGAPGPAGSDPPAEPVSSPSAGVTCLTAKLRRIVSEQLVDLGLPVGHS